MFSRIREAVRIISYREPQSGPDAVIVEREAITSSRAGTIIAGTLEVALGVYTLGYLAGFISIRLSKFIPATHSLSLTTIAGAVGALLVFLVHSIKEDIEGKIRSRLNLKEALAPYFGHRLDHAMRVLKG